MTPSFDTPAGGIASPYAGTQQVASLVHGDGVVTLVEGQTFQLSDRAGNMHPANAHGLIVLDTRVISRWELLLNGRLLEPLCVETTHPFSARFVSRAEPADGRADADLVVFRERHVGGGMREQITVTNHGLDDIAVEVQLRCEADFADLFEVKERRVRRQLGRHIHELTDDALIFGHSGERGDKQVTVTVADHARLTAGRATWQGTLSPGEQLEVWCEVTVSLGEVDIEPFFGPDADHEAAPHRRLARWRARLPEITTNHHALEVTANRATHDLGALRIFDPEHPDLPILAAGAPWFMTVFGRDSLLTAWMTLISDPSLAHGVLETLARLQGTDSDPRTEEQPGKILHEMRFGSACGLALGGGDRYYGSVDATPLYVMLLGEVLRWDGPVELIHRLLPHADRAIEWIEEFGDSDGDGYVEYHCQSETGLANQGWKDSWDAIRHANGDLAEAPIALCEVQGYVYAAYLARADIAIELGDTATAERCTRPGPGPATPVQRGLLAGGASDVRARPRPRQPADRRCRLQRRSLSVDGIIDAEPRPPWPTCCCRTTTSRASACAPCRVRWLRTTRSAITTARCGRTTTRSVPQVWSATGWSSTHTGSSRPRSTRRPPWGTTCPSCSPASTASSWACRRRTRHRARHKHGRRRHHRCGCAHCCDSIHGLPAARSTWRPELPDPIHRLRVAGIRIGDNQLTVEVDRSGVKVSGDSGLTINHRPSSSRRDPLDRSPERVDQQEHAEHREQH
jgi:glycogen debranching enzyme